MEPARRGESALTEMNEESTGAARPICDNSPRREGACVHLWRARDLSSCRAPARASCKIKAMMSGQTSNNHNDDADDDDDDDGEEEKVEEVDDNHHRAPLPLSVISVVVSFAAHGVIPS